MGPGDLWVRVLRVSPQLTAPTTSRSYLRGTLLLNGPKTRQLEIPCQEWAFRGNWGRSFYLIGLQVSSKWRRGFLVRNSYSLENSWSVYLLMFPLRVVHKGKRICGYCLSIAAVSLRKWRTCIRKTTIANKNYTVVFKNRPAKVQKKKGVKSIRKTTKHWKKNKKRSGIPETKKKTEKTQQSPKKKNYQITIQYPMVMHLNLADQSFPVKASCAMRTGLCRLVSSGAVLYNDAVVWN